jgi:hypothetical protein
MSAGVLLDKNTVWTLFNYALNAYMVTYAICQSLLGYCG